MPIASKSGLATLSDPTPPVPGPEARAAVGARADQLVRRRRILHGAGALACTAVVGVGVVALVSSTGSGTDRVETAAAPDAGTTVTAPAPVAITPATGAATPAPAAEEASPTAEETPAPPLPAAAPEPEPATAPAPDPVFASVTATASSVPAGVTLDVTLVGDGGTFTASTTNGVVSFDGIPPGPYEVRWSWQSADGAAAVGRFDVTLGAGPQSFTF